MGFRDKLKNIWNKALFIEGLRQTKWLALICFIASTFLIVLGSAATVKLDTEQYYSSSTVTIGLRSSYLFVIHLGFLIAIMVKLFGFANRKEASDFYLAMAKKRLTIYTTLVSVVLAWTIVLAVGVMLVMSVMTAVMMGDASFFGAYMGEGISYCLIMFASSVMLMGIYSLAMSITGTALANVLTMFILFYFPVWLVEYYWLKFYQLIPFIEREEGLLNIVRGIQNLFFSAFIFSASDFISFIITFVIGVVLVVVGGILFVRRKAEKTGVAIQNRFWLAVIRLALTLMVAIEADALLGGWFIHGDIESEDLWMLVLLTIVSLVVWFLFDFIIERKISKLKITLKQLPILVGINAVIVLSFAVAGFVYSRVPDLEEVESVRIKDYVPSSYDENSLPALEYIFEEEVFSDTSDIEIVYNHFKDDMESYRNSASYDVGIVDTYEVYSTSIFTMNAYDDISSREAMWVEFIVDGKPLVRKINTSYQQNATIKRMFVKRSEEITDYELPIKPYPKTVKNEDLSEGDVVYYDTSYEGYSTPELGDLYSFGWDFDQEDYIEVYNCLYDELSSNDTPLKTFMGRYSNTDGVYDFMHYYCWGEEDSISIELPISVHTPRTVETLANIGNERRKLTFDFDWFVNYIKGIGSQEKGGKLEVILYNGDGENIRYEGFGWWSDYNADMSMENLEKMQQIVNNHENDGSISADKPLLMLVYKDIEDVETTGYWFNLTKEEADFIDSIIWKEGKFKRSEYFKY